MSPGSDEFLTRDQAAELLGLPPSSFADADGDGKIRRTDLDLFLEKQKATAQVTAQAAAEDWLKAQTRTQAQAASVQSLQEALAKIFGAVADLEGRLAGVEQTGQALASRCDANALETQRFGQRLDGFAEAIESLRNATTESRSQRDEIAAQMRRLAETTTERGHVLNGVIAELRDLRLRHEQMGETLSMGLGLPPGTLTAEAIAKAIGVGRAEMAALASRFDQIEIPETVDVSGDLGGLRQGLDGIARQQEAETKRLGSLESALEEWRDKVEASKNAAQVLETRLMVLEAVLRGELDSARSSSQALEQRLQKYEEQLLAQRESAQIQVDRLTADLGQMRDLAKTMADSSDVDQIRRDIKELAEKPKATPVLGDGVTQSIQAELASIRADIRETQAKSIDPRAVDLLRSELGRLREMVDALVGDHGPENEDEDEQTEPARGNTEVDPLAPPQRPSPAKYGVVREIEINYLMERMGYRRLDSASPEELADGKSVPMPDDASIRCFLAEFELGCPVDECEMSSVVRGQWHMIQFQRVQRKTAKRGWMGRTK